MRFLNVFFFAICVLSLTVAVVGASAQVAFDKPDFDTGSGPALAPTLALDFNGDGITDLAVAVEGAILIHLNSGDGTIGPGTQFPAGNRPSVMIAGDFNGDGIADLAELGADGTVTVLLGKGDGTFSGPMSTATGASRFKASIAAADFNGDGLGDLAFTTLDGNIFVLLGNGDGTFNVSSFASGAAQLSALDAADFDGDGNVDLAVLTCCRDELGTGDLQLLHGHGDGTFGPLTEAAIVPGPVAITAAELNNDGHPDLLVAIAGCHTPCDGMEVFINRGDGTFSLTQSLSVPGLPSLPGVGDFNGDGVPDIAFSEQGNVHVYLGNGDGTFAPSQSYAKGPATTPFIATMVGDFNGDGVLDLAAPNANGTITLLTGRGDGSFNMRLRFRTGNSPVAVAAADFNGDGILDVAVANSTDKTVSVLLGNGDGTFQSKSDFSTGGLTPFALAAGDFNGDGRPDVAFTSLSSSNSVTIMLNDGSGSLSPAATLATGMKPFAIVVADFNRDGAADLAVTNANDNSVSIFLGNGDGTFASKMDFPAGPSPGKLVAADFNGDGILDLAVTAAGSRINILLGNGDGTFRAGKMVLTTGFPVSVTAGDFNGDGITDLAWVTGESDTGATVQVTLGNGDGTFGPITTMQLGGFTGGSISSADVNGDGIVDLVVVASDLTSVNGGDAAVYVGNGDGTFQSAAVFPAGFFSTTGIVADFNGDGLPDVAVITSGSFTFETPSSTMSILLNRSH